MQSNQPEQQGRARLPAGVSRIGPKLWAGGVPVSGTSRYGVPWSALEGRVEAVFSLAPVLCDLPERVRHHRFPIEDYAEQERSFATVVYLERAVASLQAELASGARVYLHCHAGISRTGLVLTALRMATNDEGWEAALAALRRCRPVLAPNPGFLRLLGEYQAHLAGRSR